MALTPGFEPGPHWWNGNALTTAQIGKIIKSRTENIQNRELIRAE